MISLPNKYVIPIHMKFDLMSYSVNLKGSTYCGKVLEVEKALSDLGYPVDV